MAKLTEKSGQKVIFRRIRGRLVPIKIDAKSSGGFKAARTRRTSERTAKRNLFKGLGLVGTGIGITVGADAISGFIVGKAAKTVSSSLVAARDFTRVAQVSGKIKGKASIGLLQRAARFAFGATSAGRQLGKISKATSFLKAGGFLLGTGATAAGINKLTESLSGKDQGATGEILSHVIGTGVTVFGARALRRGLKVGLGKKTGLRVSKGQLRFKFETGQQL